MINAKVIKSTSRTALKSRWIEAIFASLQLLAVVLVITMLNTLILSVFRSYILSSEGLAIGKTLVLMLVALCSIILFSPALLGTVRWFWALIIDKPISLSQIFYYYSDIKLILRSVLLLGITFTRALITVVLCYLPAVVAFTLSKGEILLKIGLESGDKTLSAMPIVIAFAIIGTLAFLKIALRYIFSFAISVVNEEIEPYQALILSKKITSKCRFSLVVVFFSYVGWLALSLFGVTLVYTLPLMLCSYVVSARLLITNYCIDNKIEGI